MTSHGTSLPPVGGGCNCPAGAVLRYHGRAMRAAIAVSFAVLAATLCAACNEEGRKAATTSATAPRPPVTAKPSAAFPPVGRVDNATFQRGQLTNEGLTRWDGGIVVRTAPLRRLDVAAGRTDVLTVPGAAEVIGVATWHGAAIALCRADGERYLAVKEGSGFARRELAPRLRREPPESDLPAPLYLAADDSSIVVLDGRVVHWLDENGEWHEHEIVERNPRPHRMGIPSEALLVGRVLYLGYDRGEWGGALMVVDVETGNSDVAPSGIHGHDLPLRDLARAPDGKVWIVRGLAHLGLDEGELGILDGGVLATIAASSGAKGGKVRNFSLASSSFDAVAFDAEGRALLLTGRQGVLRREGAGWVQLTRGWPEKEYVSVQDLELERETLVIAMYDAGVLLWNLADGEVRRVALQ
jgi:hypothetical protein